MIEDHKKYMREYMRERRKTLKAAGYCPNCGRRKSKDTTTALCQRCNAVIRAGWRRRDTQRRKAGLCNICGKRPPVEGYMRCRECMEKNREYHLTYQRKWRRRRKENDDLSMRQMRESV